MNRVKHKWSQNSNNGPTLEAIRHRSESNQVGGSASRFGVLIWLAVLPAVLTATMCFAVADDKSPAQAQPKPSESTDKADKKDKKGKLLFNGKTLKGWKETDFAGGGKVHAKGGELILGYGEMLTGVTYQEKPPKSNFEISLEAKRVDGSDFFCGLTFPVGEGFCTLILGGWGGSLVGLSCLNGSDASENETTYFEKFENGKWYKVRVRVTEDKVEVWINDARTINVDRQGYEFSVRWETEPSRPLGIASFQSTAAIRNLRLLMLKAKK